KADCAGRQRIPPPRNRAHCRSVCSSMLILFRRSEGNPLALRRRAGRGLGHAPDFETVAEGWPYGLAGVDRSKEVPRLDDDLVLVNSSVPRSLTERKIVRMSRTSQNLAEAALSIGALAAIKRDGVLVLLIE